ncbi:MAG: 2-oxo acid dehydrogenase subunit E2 [Solobacterium sp.]|nr:2-oxo acid dehydrogenase subunit E2 [Solobacterium sp.]MBR3345374.1 2-oxo acid dehydrogenase subunit E2 [Solobacterium sp.]
MPGKEVKRRFGDRKDGALVRDGHGLQMIMSLLMPNRADNEVFLHETIDATELVRYLEEKNSGDIDYKTTIFHCVITALARMVRERPIMNRFIQGGRIYQRYDISLSFVAKKRFTDGADEALMVLVPKDTDTINEISRKIVGDVKESRKTEGVTAGSIDELMAKLAKLPRLLLMFIVWTVRVLDYWGINPDFLTDGDPNYTTILVSNLGSIKCPSVYHHLNNYGTNSIMVTIGTLHKEEILMDDGHKEIRDVVDIGATLDERIGDGFYFAKSLKLIKHIFAHPELLEQPLNEESGFDYK